MAAFSYSLISTRNLKNYKEVIIPGIYDELEAERSVMADNYICLGARDKDGVTGALIAHIEPDTTDIQIISIYVLPGKRRKGVGSSLVKKLFDIVGNTYVFDEGEYGTDVFVKTMYCLPADIRSSYEAFLKANDFTRFYIFKKAKGRAAALCGADAQLHIYNLTDGD